MDIFCTKNKHVSNASQFIFCLIDGYTCLTTHHVNDSDWKREISWRLLPSQQAASMGSVLQDLKEWKSCRKPGERGEEYSVTCEAIAHSFRHCLIRVSHCDCALRVGAVERADGVLNDVTIELRDCERCMSQNCHDGEKYDDLRKVTQDCNLYTEYKKYMCINKYHYTRNELNILL